MPAAGANTAPKKVYRARGLQWPFNASQLMVIFAHVSNAIVFYVAVPGIDSLPFTICVTTYSIMCVIVVSCWFYTSMVDAALDAEAAVLEDTDAVAALRGAGARVGDDKPGHGQGVADLGDQLVDLLADDRV